VSAKRPVVAFYSNPSSLGGSEIYLQRILEPLLDEDWDFVFFGGDRHPLRDWLLETGRVRYIRSGDRTDSPSKSGSRMSRSRRRHHRGR
jgi:hypothetical protein